MSGVGGPAGTVEERSSVVSGSGQPGDEYLGPSLRTHVGHGGKQPRPMTVTTCGGVDEQQRELVDGWRCGVGWGVSIVGEVGVVGGNHGGDSDEPGTLECNQGAVSRRRWQQDRPLPCPAHGSDVEVLGVGNGPPARWLGSPRPLLQVHDGVDVSEAQRPDTRVCHVCLRSRWVRSPVSQPGPDHTTRPAG